MSNKKQKTVTTIKLNVSQNAKVLEAIDSIVEEDKAVILATPPGSGKTPMAKRIAHKYAKDKECVLSILVTNNADQAKKLSPLFGGMYAGGFQFNYANNIKRALHTVDKTTRKKNNVHITMTKKMFKDRLLDYNHEKKALAMYEDYFVAAIQPSEIHFILDEVSDYLNIPFEIERLRKMSSVRHLEALTLCLRVTLRLANGRPRRPHTSTSASTSLLGQIALALQFGKALVDECRLAFKSSTVPKRFVGELALACRLTTLAVQAKREVLGRLRGTFPLIAAPTALPVTRLAHRRNSSHKSFWNSSGGSRVVLEVLLECSTIALGSVTVGSVNALHHPFHKVVELLVDLWRGGGWEEGE